MSEARPTIRSIAATPIAEIRYLNAASGGGTTTARLPIHVGAIELDAAAELDAIVACSDLQGIVRGYQNTATLLGIVVAETLEELAADGKIPPLARTGVILAGDLYSVPAADKRGGRGDVSDVWFAFGAVAAWAAGVAGNHDDISRVTGDNVYLLDGNVVELDGVRIGGVGGIIGNATKPMRRDEREFLRLLDRAIDDRADIVVLHEGPHGDVDRHQRGNSAIRETLDAGEVPLAICGHDHWQHALYAGADRQILNVDSRVVVLVRQ